MDKNRLKKSLVIAIILLTSSIFSPLLTADNLSQEDVLVSFTIYGKSDVINCEVMLPYDEAKSINDCFKELRYNIRYHPYSDETESLKSSFVELLDEKGLLPEGISNNEIIESLNPPNFYQLLQNRLFKCFLPSPKISSSKGTAFFCSVASGGSGRTTPIVIGPRPHIIVFWHGGKVEEISITTVGGIRSGKGFIAYGNQNGMMIGFEGIGLTYGTPFGTVYGLTGYAIYASVTADMIDFYPPNSKPEISNPNPSNNQKNIPTSLSELSFQINDDDNELMDYSVNTDPYIGGGNENNVGNGIYSISVDGLQPSTTYNWNVTVTDGKDTTTNIFSFTTVQVAPVISNPSPSDGAYDVLISLSKLSFNLMDPQGDLMDYSVETQPDIGSANATGVNGGTYFVDVSVLKGNTQYIWSVAATDGTNSKTEFFSFRTQDEPFNPYDEGWLYRKRIMVHHTMVEGNLNDFPILVSVTDLDLINKAQNDGDDILFMDGIDVANKLPYEIEEYDGSSGILVAWVKVPNLSSTLDKKLYMYYGNSGCGSQESPKKVWDFNHIGVYHMGESSGAMDDSTTNNRDIPVCNPPTYRISGKIGKGMRFDGSNDYFEKSNYYDVSSLNGVTFEAWYEIANGWDNSKWPHIVCLGRGNNYVQNLGLRWVGYRNSAHYGELEMNAERYATQDIALSGDTYSMGWHYVVGTFTNNLVELYVDGELKNTAAADDNNFGDFTDNYIEIGCSNRKYAGWEYHPGSFDEIRVSSMVRNASWIKTQYNNQNNPSSFLSFGPEETGP